MKKKHINKQARNTIHKESLESILQELKENPFQKFSMVFALTTVIPLLTFFYLLVGRLFTFDILLGNIGVVVFISIVISLFGFYVGYNMIRNILERILFYAAETKHSDQLKSTFVATVSHEFKNPLAVIGLNIFNMLKGLLGKINEQQRNILILCQNTIGRMNRLINDLLDLHKIEAGMFEMKRRLCSLTKILESQIKELDVMFKEKSIKLNKEVLPKDLSIWADEDKIIQVVNNLMSNAIKHTPEGGTVILKAFPAGGVVRLELMDSGSGVPIAKLQKIFDKFERANSSKEGTGLGLAITKDIVELHKGRIWVESDPGKGSKFIIVLPRDLRRVKR